MKFVCNELPCWPEMLLGDSVEINELFSELDWAVLSEELLKYPGVRSFEVNPVINGDDS